MKEPKRIPEREAAAERIGQHVTTFFNIAFNRTTRNSRALIDAIYSALENRYSEDEIRLAFWAARCLTGKAAWITERLRSDWLPYYVMRHHGGVNPVTGQPAKRWLDELLARAGEMSPALAKSLLDMLPPEMQEGERALLKRMEIRIAE